MACNGRVDGASSGDRPAAACVCYCSVMLAGKIANFRRGGSGNRVRERAGVDKPFPEGGRSDSMGLIRCEQRPR